MGTEDITAGDRKADRRDELAGLRYIGHGAALPDVPARDMDADEVTALASTAGPLLMGHGGRVSFVKVLIDSGLYKES